jgi:predicted phosphodiesterase
MQALIILSVMVILLFFTGCSPQKEKFKFAVIADTHIDDNHYSKLKDFRNFLYTLNKEEKPDFLLILGDICGHQAEFLPRIKNIIDHSGLKVYTVPGNHDDNVGRSPEVYEKTFGAMNYSFDHKGWHFIMNWSQRQDTVWLKKDLDKVDPETPVIFCQHYPAFGDSAELTNPWKILLSYPNVRSALNGHVHRWRERNIGSIKSYSFKNCFLGAEQGQNSPYYIINVFNNNKIAIDSFPVSGFEIEEPPDKTPEITISHPEKSGTVLQGEIAFKGTARDDRKIEKIEYNIGNTSWQGAQGLEQWSFKVKTNDMSDGHHLFLLKAFDNRGQESVRYDSLICLVKNEPVNKKIFSFQQGVKGYGGCSDLTVRKHKIEPGVDTGNLECWLWNLKAEPLKEFSEFYIKFDVSNSTIKNTDKIKNITLTLYCTRQNYQMVKGDSVEFIAGILNKSWNKEMNFDTRPETPAWLARENPSPPPDIKGIYPRLTAWTNMVPPKPLQIDLTPVKKEIREWIRNASSNYGMVFSPAHGQNYNFSAASTSYPIPTLRPKLEIEVE